MDVPAHDSTSELLARPGCEQCSPFPEHGQPGALSLAPLRFLRTRPGFAQRRVPSHREGGFAAALSARGPPRRVRDEALAVLVATARVGAGVGPARAVALRG